MGDSGYSPYTCAIFQLLVSGGKLFPLNSVWRIDMASDDRMKAVKWTDYGKPEVMQIMEVEKPTPKANEILIKIHSSTVNVGDARLRSFDVPFGFWLPTRLVFGIFKPRNTLPGMDFSGVVEAIGKRVSKYSVGEDVFGSSGMQMGAHAEYICLNEKAVITTKPRNLTHQQAAALPFGGLTAVHFLKDKAQIKSGNQVLINGASGAVGTAAVQLAHHIGAEVTGVCSSNNIDLVKSLGADHIIDYKTSSIFSIGSRFNTILDTVGNLSLKQCYPIIHPNGKFIAINTDLSTNLYSLFQSRLIAGVAGDDPKALEYLLELATQGAMNPIIDRVYSLEEIAEAHRYVDSKHKRGNVILAISD
jgi:NADPH:quinone reductase-like Zn-dependent oxidoreductase